MARKIPTTSLDQFQPTGQEPAAKLPITSKAKRNRKWEQEQRAKPGKTTVTYRNIPVDLKGAIKDIAGKLNVNIDDVARAFLERGLADYENGELELNPRLKRGKFGLYGKED